ncbi:hypothetical protein EDB83DRAFT_2311230 [Lactarius deliciosus]|nr:hypothetical protein EDB83DRAFT_2311230 [Lactarius deliciosus]
MVGLATDKVTNWQELTELSNTNGNGNGDDDNDDNSDNDGDEEEKEPAAPSTAHQTAHPHGLNAPIESTTSTKSTTTPPDTESSTQALESSMQPSTQPSDLMAKPLESAALPDAPLAIPTLDPLSSRPGPPSLSPSCALPELAVSAQGRWLRKANVLSLNMCVGSVTITNPKISAGVNVMRCRVLGCETVWGNTQGVTDIGKAKDDKGEVEYDEGEVGDVHNL